MSYLCRNGHRHKDAQRAVDCATCKRNEQRRAAPKHLDWKVHTPNLLQEVLSNNTTAILKKPLQILGHLLADVAARAIELDDPKLNHLMCRLALYSVADPSSKDYSPRKLKIVERRARA